MNFIRIFALLATTLSIGCATGPSGQVFDSPIGEWNEKHETMSGGTRSVKLNIIDKTHGIYSTGLLEIYSVEDAHTWKGYWIDDTGRHACSEKKQGSPYWGEQVFHFNEAYNQYTATWDMCGKGPKLSARGYR